MRGRRVGEWFLEECVGRGGFAEVWRARHSVFSERLAAIKIPTDQGYRDYLRREGTIQDRLRHDNIVEILGADMDSDPPYLAMEFMGGGALRKRLENRSLSVDETRELMRQILSALKFAHSKGVVHCDIKPENILFTEEGVAKLSDFGMWRYKSELARRGKLSLTFASEDSPYGGTILYMSPEQQRGEEVEPSDDLWALGVVLFECLTGRLPAPGDKISDFCKSAPEWAEKFFSKTFLRRERRAKSADELLSCLPGPKERPPKRVVVRNPEVVGRRQEEVAPREGGCAPVLFGALLGLIGLFGGFACFPLRFEGAITGAVVGMVLGANIFRPLTLLVLISAAVAGGLLIAHPLGGMIGVVLSMVILSLLRSRRETT